jgi:hypothetical protein
MKHTVKIVTSLLAFVMLVTCKKRDDIDKPPATAVNDTVRVEYFRLLSDASLNYPGGTVVIAENGATIQGELIIEGRGGFELRVLNGDIIMEGSIVSDTSSYQEDTKSNKAANAVIHGNDFLLHTENGNHYIEPEAYYQAENGSNAPNLSFTDVTESNSTVKLRAEDGGNGGNIIISAPRGIVYLPDLESIPEGHILMKVGNGGRGGSITLDPSLFSTPPSVRKLEVYGGKGGNSGKIVLQADKIDGMWTPDDLIRKVKYPIFNGGKGGDGGNVVWIKLPVDNDIFQSALLVEFASGDGGNGMLHGGNGGYVYCYLRWVINRLGDPVTNILVRSGFGGSIFPADLPVYKVVGGDGGAFAARGAAGWDGGVAPETFTVYNDGANGGNVTATGGKGGDILESVKAVFAQTGEGSLSSRAQIDFVNAISSGNSFTHKVFGVISGDGGKGMSACIEECRGETRNPGDGGNSGSTAIVAGFNGTVKSKDILFPTQYDAGDIWTYGTGNAGNGGDGQTPGNGGTPNAYIEAVVNGDGEILGDKIEGTKGLVGSSCSVPEIPDTSYYTTDCPEGSTRATFYWYLLTEYDFVEQITYRNTTEIVYLERKTCTGWVPIMQQETFVKRDSSWTKTYTDDWTGSVYFPPFAAYALKVNCDVNGNLIIPGAGSWVDTHLTGENGYESKTEYAASGCLDDYSQYAGCSCQDQGNQNHVIVCPQ